MFLLADTKSGVKVKLQQLNTNSVHIIKKTHFLYLKRIIDTLLFIKHPFYKSIFTHSTGHRLSSDLIQIKSTLFMSLHPDWLKV